VVARSTNQAEFTSGGYEMTLKHLPLLLLALTVGACSKQPSYGTTPARDSAKSRPNDQAQEPGEAPTDGGRRVP
jgi:hypothetical protein